MIKEVLPQWNATWRGTQMPRSHVLNVAEECESRGRESTDSVVERLLKEENGSPLYFPAGTYNLEKTIRVDRARRIYGDGIGSTRINSSANPAIHIGGDSNDPYSTRGTSVEHLTIWNPDSHHGKDAIKVVYCAKAFVSYVRMVHPFDGLYVNHSLVDVNVLEVADHDSAAVRVVDCGGDNFFSKVTSNTSTPVWDDRGIMKPFGAWLSNAGGTQFTDCDFLRGRCGVMLDELGAPNGGNDWVKFSNVSADTSELDCWHIQQAKGLQMANCWSGTFPNGSGIWLGPKAEQISIANHQFQNGLVGLNNNSRDAKLIGYIFGANVQTKVNSSVPGQPVLHPPL